MKSYLLLLAVLILPVLSADIRLPSLIGDHMVLQRSSASRLWGTAAPGEKVSAEIGGIRGETTADRNGKWLLHLDTSRLPDGPFVLTFKGRNRCEIRDVLIGDVWVAGGQSNMEKPIGKQPGQFPTIRWQEAVRKSLPRTQIRIFRVGVSSSRTEQDDCRGRWMPPSENNTPTFTAVGYFFAEVLNENLQRPIGIINNSVGGTSVFRWTGRETLLASPDTAELLKEQDRITADTDHLLAWLSRNGRTFRAFNSKQISEFLASGGWSKADFAGKILPEYGIVWFKATVRIPEQFRKNTFSLKGLSLRNVYSQVSCNGRLTQWNGGEHANLKMIRRADRGFIPGDSPDGVYTIAYRLAAPLGNGEVVVPKEGLKLVSGDCTIPVEWQKKVEVEYAPLKAGETLPAIPGASRNLATFYNGMVAPLRNLSLTGVIWYQGESDWQIPDTYQRHFSNMITDWRNGFGNPQLPFYFCQLPGFGNPQRSPEENSVWARLRNAQLQVARTVPGTGMAVLIDLGEAQDIHPRRKREVGERLARTVLAKVYGKKVEYSGPLYRSFRVEDGKIRLFFDFAENGLKAVPVPPEYDLREGARRKTVRNSPGSPLEGFAIQDSSGKWHWAHAEIDGRTVLVSHPQVKVPRAVRYDWGNFVFGNLRGENGLPAAPFTTESR